MFGRNMNKDPETIQLWKSKYEKLAKDYSKVKKELDSVKQYKEEYEDLIKSVTVIKERYKYLVDKEEELYLEYKEEFGRLHDLAAD